MYDMDGELVFDYVMEQLYEKHRQELYTIPTSFNDIRRLLLLIGFTQAVVDGGMSSIPAIIEKFGNDLVYAALLCEPLYNLVKAIVDAEVERYTKGLREYESAENIDDNAPPETPSCPLQKIGNLSLSSPLSIKPVPFPKLGTTSRKNNRDHLHTSLSISEQSSSPHSTALESAEDSMSPHFTSPHSTSPHSTSPRSTAQQSTAHSTSQHSASRQRKHGSCKESKSSSVYSSNPPA